MATSIIKTTIPSWYVFSLCSMPSADFCNPRQRRVAFSSIFWSLMALCAPLMSQGFYAKGQITSTWSQGHSFSALSSIWSTQFTFWMLVLSLNVTGFILPLVASMFWQLLLDSGRLHSTWGGRRRWLLYNAWRPVKVKQWQESKFRTMEGMLLTGGS